MVGRKTTVRRQAAKGEARRDRLRPRAVFAGRLLHGQPTMCGVLLWATLIMPAVVSEE